MQANQETCLLEASPLVSSLKSRLSGATLFSKPALSLKEDTRNQLQPSFPPSVRSANRVHQVGRAKYLSYDELSRIYEWIDEIPLSRPKRNISRDFSDAVLMAEVANHCFPKIADMHNYSPANSVSQKRYNWETINRKVFHLLGITLHPEDMEDAANAKPFVVERIIKLLLEKLQDYRPHAGCGVEHPIEPMLCFLNEGCRCAGANLIRVGECANHYNSARSNIEIMENSKQKCFSEGEWENGFKLQEMQESNHLLQEKVRHLEKLLKIKDARIEALMLKLSRYG